MTKLRALLIFLAAAVFGYFVWVGIEQARLVRATPANESAFLKTYSPNPVVDRFKVAAISEESGSSEGSDIGFAIHQREFGPTVIIHSADWIALMQALRDDIASRLAAQQAEIVEESGSAADGFTIQYASGRTRGTLLLGPLKGMPEYRISNAEPGSDQVPVSVRIRIDEKWFKSGTPATQMAHAED